jgi:BirA family transcriptional regulator, biotin operon repressor / biotin---[acetyl-CoA-carboxylase] ligase
MSDRPDPDRRALDASALRRDLIGADALWHRIDILDRTESTNADAAAAAREGVPEGLVVTTEHQVAGRGRLGRSWQSPPMSGLAVSVVLRPASVAPARWPWLPLLAGVAVRESVVDSAGVDASLKWPNDVLVAGRKLAGILVERVDTPIGAAAVVGIGVNVSLDTAELPVPEATSLALAGAVTTDRTVLTEALLRRLAAHYRAWLSVAGDPEHSLRAEYAAACGTIGQRVRIELPDGSAMVGLALGIDPAGRLEVDVDGERQTVGAGDVVHLRSGS